MQSSRQVDEVSDLVVDYINNVIHHRAVFPTEPCAQRDRVKIHHLMPFKPPPCHQNSIKSRKI